MNAIAERYVKLVLALGQHDADYVDAYYGPPEWKKEAESAKVPLEEIAARAKTLLDAVTAAPTPSDEMERLRVRYLERQLSSLAARMRMLKGERLSFDEESRALRRRRARIPNRISRRSWISSTRSSRAAAR